MTAVEVAMLINRAWVVLWRWADVITAALEPCRAHRACLMPIGHQGTCIPAKPKPAAEHTTDQPHE